MSISAEELIGLRDLIDPQYQTWLIKEEIRLAKEARELQNLWVVIWKGAARRAVKTVRKLQRRDGSRWVVTMWKQFSYGGFER